MASPGGLRRRWGRVRLLQGEEVRGLGGLGGLGGLSPGCRCQVPHQQLVLVKACCCRRKTNVCTVIAGFGTSGTLLVRGDGPTSPARGGGDGAATELTAGMAPWASSAAAAAGGEALPLQSVDYLAAVHAVEGGAAPAADLEVPYGLGGLPTPGSRMLLQRQQPHQGPKVGGWWVGGLMG